MNEKQRLGKALTKIEARKKRLRERGVTEPSKVGYMMRDIIAPAFRGAVKVMYPKSGFVQLGNTTKKDIFRITKGQPVIYAAAHRSVFDVARLIAYAVPHSYLVLGDERSFYCTINEHLINLSGVLHVDREDPKDSKLIVDRASMILKSNQSILLCPEGTPNVYGREMLKLYPGVIKMALNTGVVVVPVGNELYIKRDQNTSAIIGDINYMMYEDYCNGQTLFRPSDNKNLAALHEQLHDVDYLNVLDDQRIEACIQNGQFVLGDVSFGLEETLKEFLSSHPLLGGFFVDLADKGDKAGTERARKYLVKCSIISEYRKMLIACLNELEQRMKTLSERIIGEIDRRYRITAEEHERNSREYIDYFLKVHEKIAKKGRSNAYNEIDKFINKRTDESIIASETQKVLEGLRRLS